MGKKYTFLYLIIIVVEIRQDVESNLSDYKGYLVNNHDALNKNKLNCFPGAQSYFLILLLISPAKETPLYINGR